MYNEIVNSLDSISQFASSTGLERGRQLLHDMNNPEKSLKIIHVAGTNGKGSVCAYIAGILQHNGYKTGLFTSPHLVEINERFQINEVNIDNDTFQKEFDKINEDEDIDGILLLRPLPKHLDEKAIENRIASVKDLDGISPMNLAKVYAGDPTGYGPCTAEAVIEMLDYAGVDLKGKRAVVIGRSLVIGKPVAMMLMKKNATVTVCHTKTVDMPGVCKGAEVLVAAAGVAKMVDKSFVADGAVVIDVGINVDEDGNLCGDVDFEDVAENASVCTPVPGGVGSVTTSVLAKHLLKAAKARRA